MQVLSRRRLLATSAALPFAAGWASPPIVQPPPRARIEVVRDTYFGETLSDPYRWMENDKDPAWLPYLKAQNDRTRAVLDGLADREPLLKRIQALSGEMASTSRVQRAGGRLFFQQRPLGADNFKLFVREGDRDRLLVDPTALSSATSHMSLDWWRASPDGRLVVYGLSKDGSEDSLLHVLDVPTGRDLPDRIANTQAANPRWLEDGSGFFYNQLTGAVDTPERFLDSQARFHRLGSDPASDPILMKRGLDPAVVFEKIQAPYIEVHPGSRWALLGLGDVRQETRVLVAPLADVLSGRARWTPVASFEDGAIAATLDGDDILLLLAPGVSRGRLVRVPAADPVLARAREVVPEGRQVLNELAVARDGVYLLKMDGGVNRLARVSPSGAVAEVVLPFESSIGGVFTDPKEDGALLLLSGWLTSPGVWSVATDLSVVDTGLNPRPAIDLSVYEAVRGFAKAKDGVRIPYVLIRRRGLKPDGRTPTYIQAYGSYGSTPYSPRYDPRALALIDAGAIVGYANVRGGGEYGREWHKAGQLANKPNTWRDLIAVCEDVIAQGWTSPSHLAIGGRSAGGITVGRALTERPDLFAAVIDGVGWSNPLRYVVEQNGYGEEPEWGAITDRDGYRYLKAIDSYQAVRDGARYPAVLLTTGVTDPRVAPFHVAKMTARLQAATTSDKPILLRVDYDAGHGVGSTRAQQDREAADTYAFLLWRLQGSSRAPSSARKG